MTQKKSKNKIVTENSEGGKSMKEEKYVIRKINSKKIDGKYKATKYNPKKMKLRIIDLGDNKVRNERTYTKAQVEKWMAENGDMIW
jgi:hypothetical protein